MSLAAALCPARVSASGKTKAASDKASNNATRRLVEATVVAQKAAVSNLSRLAPGRFIAAA